MSESAAEVRSDVYAAFAYLGVRLDAARNLAPPANGKVAAADSIVPVVVIPTEEDWMIARVCWRLLRSADTPCR